MMSVSTTVMQGREKSAAPIASIVVFVAATALLFALQGDKILEWVYLGMGLLVALFLYHKSSGHYICFVWWLWFLSPEVRRFSDYHIGWNWASPIVLTPLLSSAIAAVSLPRLFLGDDRLLAAAIVLISFGLAYGYAIGIQTSGLPAATFAALNWIVPPIFCAYIVTKHREIVNITEMTVQTFVWGGLICGIYGVIQFFFLPGWDAYWMINARMGSEGLPLPGFVRIFGTMNSSGPFASTMVVCLVISLTSTHRLRWAAAAPVIASIFLSLVRTAWFGLAISLLYLLLRLRGGGRLKLIFASMVFIIVSIPILSLDPVAQKISERFGTFGQLSADGSYQERNVLYEQMIAQLLQGFVGAGLGATGQATKLNNQGEVGGLGNIDSGLLEIPLTLGWLGALLYFAGIGVALFVGLKQDASPGLLAAFGAIAVGTSAQLLLGNSVIGETGMLFWCFLGILIAYHKKTSPTGVSPTIYRGNLGRPNGRKN
jgi:hypothetical protein